MILTALPINLLVVELLEARRLFSGRWQGVDIDGDYVAIKIMGAGEFDVLTTEEGLGERIDGIEVWDTTDASKLKITARKKGGDGYVDVDEIIATEESLKEIKVDGNLGFLTVDAVRKLTVVSSATFDGNEAEWLIEGRVKKMRLKGDLEDVIVEVGGPIKKVVIDGDITAATLMIDGQLRQLRVRGDMEEDSYVYAAGDIHRIAIDGFLNFSSIETGGALRRMFVGLDVLDADIFAGQSIRRLTVDGAVEGTVIETVGFVRIIDVWDWINESDIIAGPEGIGAVWAYTLADTVIDTAGDLRHVFLDEDPFSIEIDDYFIVEEDIWYWPPFDEGESDALDVEGYTYDDLFHDDDYYGGYHQDKHHHDDNFFFVSFGGAKLRIGFGFSF